MMMQALTGALLLAAFADFHQDVSPASWGWLIGMGVIHSGIVMVAMYATFPLLPTPVIAIMNFVYPACVILIDWLIYDHLLSMHNFGQLAKRAAARMASAQAAPAPPPAHPGDATDAEGA